MNPIQYAKEHPIAATAIVVIGGIVFFAIFTGGGSTSNATVAGPSDAEVAANASVKAAEIQASAIASQAGAAIQAAQIGAGVQMNSDNLAAQVAMEGLRVQDLINTREAASRESELEYYYMSNIAGINADKEMTALTLAENTKQLQISTDASLSAAQIASEERTAERMLIEGTTRAVLNAQTETITNFIQSEVDKAAIAATTAITLDQNEKEAQMYYLDKTAEISGLQINALRDVELANIEGNITLQENAINAEKERTGLLLSYVGTVKKKDRDELIQSINTGQVVQKASNPSTFSQDISAIAGAVGTVGSALSFLSDEDAKENIVHTGEYNPSGAIYEYNFKGNPNRRFRGSMAGEVERSYNGDTDAPVHREKRSMWRRLKERPKEANKQYDTNRALLRKTGTINPFVFNPGHRSYWEGLRDMGQVFGDYDPFTRYH